jgi:hypothetical protein
MTPDGKERVVGPGGQTKLCIRFRYVASSEEGMEEEEDEPPLIKKSYRASPVCFSRRAS